MSVFFSPNAESPSQRPLSYCDFEVSLMVDNLTHPYKQCRVLTIDDLSDDDLLGIFDFYVVRNQNRGYRRQLNGRVVSREIDKIESWQSLVHVCRRWRCLVFGSRRRLNLQITLGRTAKRSLDVWPALPILIYGSSGDYAHDVIAVLRHSDRIRQIDLHFWQLGKRWTANLFAAMKVPFPELVTLHLSLENFYLYGPVLPDSFLGGSAPRLRSLALTSIPFPGLPKLLLSSTHLVQLHLHDIPHYGYISPEAMATCLSLLTSLESLQLDFIPPPSLSYPDLKNRRPFPPTRSVLPTLTKFWFKGLNEYLQEFVARIDTPQLSSITFSDVIDFDTPEINRFISRTPTFGAYDEAHLTFHSHWVLIRLRQSHPGPSDHRMVQVKILGEESDRQLSILAKICTLSLRLLLTMENLYINVAEYTYSVLVWVDDIENTEWFDLLLPFTAVKNLYLSKPVSPRIALALQKLTWERTTEVFPALQTILLEGFQPERVHKGITRFMSARQLINHPVAISVWDRSLKGDKS